jgi:hypothetical protein
LTRLRFYARQFPLVEFDSSPPLIGEERIDRRLTVVAVVDDRVVEGGRLAEVEVDRIDVQQVCLERGAPAPRRPTTSDSKPRMKATMRAPEGEASDRRLKRHRRDVDKARDERCR